ncbi:TRAFAC clade GTPase domain-containing protein [Streptomyces phaeochromogenes]
MSPMDVFSGPPVVTALVVLLAIQSPVIVWNLLRSAPVAYTRFVTETGRNLGPWRPTALDARVHPPGGAEPAFKSYWAQQAWTDAVTAAATGATEIWRRVVDVWVKDRLLSMLDSHRGPYLRREPWEVFFLRFFSVGVALGALLGSFAAAATAVITMLLFGVLLCAVCAVLVLAAGFLRGLDTGRLTVGKIRMKCPHPGCYRSVQLPVYRCPRCRSPHSALRPGRYGILRRVCACGQRLHTSFLTGRHRYDAECPACSLPLPDGLGSARLVHVPLIGGTSSGKSMLLQAMVSGLLTRMNRGELSVRFAREADRKEHERGAARMASGAGIGKTTSDQPTAVMLYVGGRRRRRLLYLYDPRGEILESTRRLQEQEYLAHVDALVLVVDALADPAVQTSLAPDEQARARLASPSAESPTYTFERLSGELAAMSRRRRRRIPVAVVVTKRDVLPRLPSLPTLGDSVDGWLRAVGLENLVRGLERDFGACLFTALSAQDAIGTQAREAERRHAAEPVLWLLRHTGLRIRKRPPTLAAGRIPPHPATDQGVAKSS